MCSGAFTAIFQVRFLARGPESRKEIIYSFSIGINGIKGTYGIKRYMRNLLFYSRVSKVHENSPKL